MFIFPASLSTNVRHLVVCLTTPSKLNDGPTHHYNVHDDDAVHSPGAGQASRLHPHCPQLLLDDVLEHDVDVRMEVCNGQEGITVKNVDLQPGLHKSVNNVVSTNQQLSPLQQLWPEGDGHHGHDSQDQQGQLLVQNDAQQPPGTRLHSPNSLNGFLHHQHQISPTKASISETLKLKIIRDTPEDGLHNKIVGTGGNNSVLHSFHSLSEFITTTDVVFTVDMDTDVNSCFDTVTAGCLAVQLSTYQRRYL